MNALLIDIGNSRVKGRLIQVPAGRTVEVPPTTADRIDRLDDDWHPLAGAAIDVALISNVARPDTEAGLEAWLRATWPAIRIERIVPGATTAGLINGYRHPEKLGPDRWMALVGASAMLPNRSLLVCSFGTATTLDLLLHDPGAATTTFVGGSILPGEDAMRTALLAHTARLLVGPGAIIDFADNTEDAIASGVRLAQRGAVQQAWQDARRLATHRLECVLAGGASATMLRPPLPIGPAVHHAPDLVLHGLAVLATEYPEVAERLVTMPQHPQP